MAIRKRKFYRRPIPRGPRRNEQIRAEEVRLIDEKGENVGVVSIQKALEMAREAEHDLIEISEKAVPPVVRIMDYGKYMYEQDKKNRGADKKQKISNIVKGVRISIRMSPHDMEIKAQNVDKFLKKGYKVRVEMIMRGREKALRDIADKKIKDFLEIVQEEHEIEQAPTRHPRGLYFTLKKTMGNKMS